MSRGQRKPIRGGLGVDVLSFEARDESGELRPQLFTRAGAQQYADRQAKRSGIRGAVGLVSDCGTHWGVNVAGQPFER